MKHRIITTFTFVLLVVLALSFLSLYFVFYTMYIKEQETMLEHTIDLVDVKTMLPLKPEIHGNLRNLPKMINYYFSNNGNYAIV